MYLFCVTVQYVAIILCLFGLAYLLKQWPSRPQSVMLFLGVAILMYSIGYLLEITSDSLAEALMATKISYVGKVYISPLAFFFVLYYYRIKISQKLIMATVVAHTMILVLILTCEHHDFFYTDISFVREGFFPHLSHWHGAGYVAYMALVLCYGLITLTVCVVQYLRVKSKEKEKALYLLVMILVPVLSLALYLSGITQGYDVTAVGYVFSGIVLFLSIFRYDFFDTVNLAKDYVVENLADGLVVLGPQGEFVYANAPAYALFPNLATKEYESAIQEIGEYCVKKKRLHVEQKVYRITEQNILQNEKMRGKMYYLQEVTDSYNYTAKLEAEVRDKAQELFNSHHSLVVSLANMVEARDGVTGQHVKHTSRYVEIMARGLKKKEKYKEIMSNSYISVLCEASPLHDIGKISMKDSILRKEGSLNTEELKSIQTHAAIGAEIIDTVLEESGISEYLVTAKEMAYSHHERWDGKGYPQGLKGEEIPLSARIMAIADVYDALRSERSYKTAYSKEVAKQIIVDESGKQFDPELVQVFLECLSEIEAVQ